MKTWVVWKRNGAWGLYIRDYPTQGISPSYSLFKEIDFDTALGLVNDELADDLYGQLEREGGKNE